MTRDYQHLWAGVASATDKAQAVRTLADILTNKEGRALISRLDSGDAELCIEILSNVSRDLYLARSPPHTIRQGITAYNLKHTEKQAFFVTLRRLAERHGRLPDRLTITEEIEISDETLTFGGFACVRSGRYKGRLVAVRTMRTKARAEFPKIRKVSTNVGHEGRGLNHSIPAILQGSHPLGNAIPPERVGPCWGSGGREERSVHHRVRVDDARDHHGIHKKPLCQQTGAGMWIHFRRHSPLKT